MPGIASAFCLLVSKENAVSFSIPNYFIMIMVLSCDMKLIVIVGCNLWHKSIFIKRYLFNIREPESNEASLPCGTFFITSVARRARDN